MNNFKKLGEISLLKFFDYTPFRISFFSQLLKIELKNKMLAQTWVFVVRFIKFILLNLSYKTELQSTPQWRGDLALPALLAHWVLFQSTPQWRGDCFAASHTASVSSFNPRPSEGATQRVFPRGGIPLVSIHAPVKGRLASHSGPFKAEGVSIHAPVKGRPAYSIITAPLPPVSIHAPVKGRHVSPSKDTSTSRFQSTPQWRGDQNPVSRCPAPLGFQSTPQWRGDPA